MKRRVAKEREPALAFRKEDRLTNYRAKFLTTDNKKIRALAKPDIKELMELIAETDMDMIEHMPKTREFDPSEDMFRGINSLNIGIGTLRIVYRAPMKIKNVHTGEEQMSHYSPLFYFRPKPELKTRVKTALNEQKRREKEIENGEENSNG